MKNRCFCVGMSLLACMSVVVLFEPSSTSAETVVVKYKSTPTPSTPLPADVKTIRVQRPSYGNRAADNGFLNTNVHTRFERLPGAYSVFWGPYWGYYGTGSGARSQRYNDDGFYRFVIGELERQISKSRPDIRLLDIEDRMIRSDNRDDARAQGRSGGHAVSNEASPDAVIIVRFGLEVRDESKIVRRKPHETLLGMTPVLGRLTRASMPSVHQEWVRTVVVTCSMDLENIRTGRLLHSYTGVLDETEETDAGILGYGADHHADLTPIARVAKKLIATHVERFLGKLVPVERSTNIRLKRVDDRTAKAVYKLNRGEAQAAAMLAKEAYIAGGDDPDHRAAFVAGKACERMGKTTWARIWLQRAIHLKSKEPLYSEHLASLDDEQLDRQRAVYYQYEQKGDPPTKPGEDVVLVKDSKPNSTSEKSSELGPS